MEFSIDKDNYCLLLLFLFPEGQIHQNQPVCLHLYASIVETIFNTKLNILFIKYTDTLTFNFTHTINGNGSIMPL